MTTFLFIRHAATDVIGKTLAGDTPGVHLNDEGSGQTERLAHSLSALPVRAIYSSPLERAVETAGPVARKLGLDVQIRPRIREIGFGEWSGLTLEALANSAEWQRFNSFRSGTRAPDGELMLETQARVVTEVEELRRCHGGEMVALFTHADVIKAAVAHYSGIPLDLFHRLEISPASTSVMTVAEWGPRILCVNHTGALPSVAVH